MSDYISRSALLDACNFNLAGLNNRISRRQRPCYHDESKTLDACNFKAMAYDDVIKMITNSPDAERVGHWIEDGDVQICSECGEEHEWVEYRASFCDTCGARMVKGGERHD